MAEVEKSKKDVVKEDSDEMGNTLTDKIRGNPWIVSTIVLGIITLIFIIGDLSGGVTGAAIGSANPDAIGQKIVEIINSNAPEPVELVGVEKESGLYKVTFLTSQGESSVYVTQDGTNIINGLIPMATIEASASGDSETETGADSGATEVPKSEKPKVELFVMSMCPYGTQAEKGLIPALETLGDKIDFDLRFVSYAMHGKDEVDENTVQYCIQKEEPAKLYDYLRCYLGSSDKGNWNACLTDAGINKAKITSCVSATDKEFKITELFNDESTWSGGRYPQYNVDKVLNTEYGVQGSPTLVINGEQVNVARSPSAYLGAICDAFNTAPEECDAELSVSASSPGFGWETTAASANTAAQCG